jgi:hypothetical protein
MKRARRLHRLVYGPYYSENMVKMLFVGARTAVIFSKLGRALREGALSMRRAESQLRQFQRSAAPMSNRVKELQEQAAVTRAVQAAIDDGVVRGVEIDTFNALFPDGEDDEGEREGDFAIFDPRDKTWVERDPPLVEGALAAFVDDEEEAGLWSEAEANRIALLLDEPGKLQVRRLFILGRNC